MIKPLRHLIDTVRRSALAGPIERLDDLIRFSWQRGQYRKWAEPSGRLPIPDLYKQRTLRDIAQRYHLRTLVETGTFFGDMVAATHQEFSNIYTIELAPHLYARARRRFAGQKHIEVLQGDSGQVLDEVIPKLTEPTLFWLDAHYSAGFTARGTEDSPVLKELQMIFASSIKKFAILVDDAADFGGEGGYPTIDQVRKLVAQHSPEFTVTIKNYAIHILPKP